MSSNAAADHLAGELPVPRRRATFLAAFGYRDFSLLWSGLFVGNVGTWMQFTALGYYVARLAPDTGVGAFYIGLLGASRMVPVLLASPFAGVVADRYPRRPILLSTNVLTAAIAVLMSLALATGTASLEIVLLLSALQGATQSFDAPARQSWVPLLVPRELVGNAIGLNSVAFNAPSVAGPPLAGLLIAATGVAPCMLLNAVVKFAVVLAILAMKPSPASSHGHGSFGSAIGEGIRFVSRHSVLRWIYLMLIVSALTVRSYNFLLPAFAVHVLQTDARGLGLLMGAAGIGAMLGALSIAATPSRRRSGIWVASAVVSSAGVSLLGISSNVWLAALVLLLVGLGTQSFTGTSNVLVQTLAPDDMRGRAVSVYSMIMLGLVPGGALLIGSVARFVELRVVFVAVGAIASAIAVWIYLSQPRLRAS